MAIRNPTVMTQLQSAVQDQKILLYSIEDGATCIQELAGVDLVLRVILMAIAAEGMRNSPSVIRIKKAYAACSRMIDNDSYELAEAGTISSAVDEELKFARLLSPAAIIRAMKNELELRNKHNPQSSGTELHTPAFPSSRS